MARKKTPGQSLRDALFTGLTGRPAGGTGSVTDLLTTAYGPGPRGGRVDTRTAAVGLGVSQRTVQRWVAAEGRQRVSQPKPDTMSALNRAARQAVTTKAGRRRAVAVRRAQLGNQGVRLTVQGVQGVVTHGTDYRRQRSTSIELSPDQAQEIFDAYENQGDKGTGAWMTDRFDQDYVSDWSFDRVDQVTLDPMD